MTKKVEVWFEGIDGFNCAIFKDKFHNRYGTLDKLFSYTETENSILQQVHEEDLTYFGNSFDCEPMGTEVNDLLIIKEK